MKRSPVSTLPRTLERCRSSGRCRTAALTSRTPCAGAAESSAHRFRIVNGCDSRFLACFLTEAEGGKAIPATWKIGGDGGLLNAPVAVTQWVWGPGERVDMVFDFSDPSLWGRTFVLRNKGKSPYPNGDPVDPMSSGQIMAFRVVVASLGAAGHASDRNHRDRGRHCDCIAQDHLQTLPRCVPEPWLLHG